MTITPTTIPMMRPRFDASDVPSPLCQKNYEKSLLASFVHLHEIIRRYFTHGFTSDPNLLSPDSRSSFFESKFDLQNT